MNVVVQSFSKNHIDATVQLYDSDLWRFIDFYGELDNSKRKRTWNLLKSLARQSSQKWVVMGDYNEITSHEDKLNGARVPEWRLQDMRNALSYCGLIDVDFEGYRYSWSNNQDQSTNTQDTVVGRAAEGIVILGFSTLK